MKTETYELLMKLYEKYGAREFGKLCQKFLAIGFQMAGYRHIVERGVQGVDVDVAGESGEKYAIEVKTTVTDSINFGQKDIEGLMKRKENGYQAVLAVLRLKRFSDWLFARADTIKPGNLIIDSLRAHRLPESETIRLRSRFDEAVKEHFERTLQEGQRYLDDVLRKKGIGSDFGKNSNVRT